MYETLLLKYFSRELSRRFIETELPIDYFAENCRISIISLKECFNGDRLASPLQLVLMAEIFECTVNDLLGFDNIILEPKQVPSTIIQYEYKIADHMWEEIYYRIEEKGMTAEDLRSYVGVNKETVRLWLHRYNRSYPKTIHLIRICDALDCTPSDLLGY